MSTTARAIRLIATDLDGTLLHDDQSVSARTCAALARVATAGIHIVLVSARPPRILKRMAGEIGVSGLAICCNGAITYDLMADRVVAQSTISPNEALTLMERLRERDAALSFAAELGLRFACDTRWAIARGVRAEDQMDLADALTIHGEPVTKLVVRHDNLAPEALLALVQETIGAAATVTYSGAPFIEISAVGVQKAWALEALCKHLGVHENAVMAFGDMPNDLPMLEWAGVGVAVANAHPSVRARADLVTGSNMDDGVAEVIERLLAANGEALAAHVLEDGSTR